ncbi:protein EARLY HEADING DATE 2-like [Triticum dicoccoides]|uniref:protein EARLY HEADING DATE 2-like n=1 Tax=Triticum dicoccoides TaxID=85692 RepID=UPI0018918978|nr:protein EARLY HEADING DATE 2-like [Triticum dicoccoides]
MMLCDLSSDHHEATGSSSHGGDLGFSSHVLLSPLFAPAATSMLLPRPAAPPLEEPARAKRKRSQPGNPDPGAEVIALSPRTLVATNRFVCEICNKGFQRDQNLQLHRRGHNLPWKLRQRTVLLPRPGGDGSGAPRKRVYVCPEPTCVHHDPARALGDLTGIKKHFSRKHGEKRWKCDRCAKRYAVHSDWKAHVKNCGTREYRCDCGILFSRKDSLLTHRAFCDALAEESARLIAAANNNSAATTCNNNNSGGSSSDINNMLMPSNSSPLFLPFASPPHAQNPNPLMFLSQEPQHHQVLPPFQPLTYLDDLPMTTGSGSAVSADTVSFRLTPEGSVTMHAGGRHLTRDFLGVDNSGEVEELQMSVPLCATPYQGRSVGSATACCATDLTRQYLGRLPPVNEPWSHNF